MAARRATLYTEQGPKSAGREAIPGTSYFRSARASREAARIAKGHEPVTVEQYAKQREAAGLRKPVAGAPGPHVMGRHFRQGKLEDLRMYTVNGPDMKAVVRVLERVKTTETRIAIKAVWTPSSMDLVPELAAIETPLHGEPVEGTQHTRPIDRIELLETAKDAAAAGSSVSEWLALWKPDAAFAEIQVLSFEEI